MRAWEAAVVVEEEGVVEEEMAVEAGAGARRRRRRQRRTTAAEGTWEMKTGNTHQASGPTRCNRPEQQAAGDG